MLKAIVRYSVKEEVEDRGKGQKGCTEKQSISATWPAVLSTSGDVNKGTQSLQCHIYEVNEKLKK